MGDFDLDEILATICRGEALDEEVLVKLLMKLMEVLSCESNLIEISSPITICGDVHGQLYDVFELFKAGGDPATTKYLFMGDYVDRGYYSVLTFSYLAALKLRYPGNVYLLRGNHECRQVNQMYGFYAECVQTYGHIGVWNLCNEVFDLLPYCALIDGEIFSTHGGLSPQIPLIDKINSIYRVEDVPATGPFADLTWSDPDDCCWSPNPRGAGHLFGERPTREFCHLNGLRFVTRSHQLVMQGYEWYFNKLLVNVWSAPNYMYRSGNQASVMKYAGNGENELVIFGPCPTSEAKVPAELPTSSYFL
ncbi:Ser/Thr protein phosphatase, putative [Trichomonas vaginalis G3]|uniref:Serine/threonine-protein phosphatase n=1 Tax=Trichomonas vaginalis (strain ATCC PRA-98 / G3) TaxID=412133 RepID=A2ET12_TRIV3|nr:serine threonine-protein phosphatase family [Trichomonas vaginalis G3]EAY04201.1 Ser/Thr protein phosphatase, putative [Trichomonas vaginalis G3]KAI5493075.1 serine threonine-protein phosphatase family [Trichomonas vaginalis G3]|eukprot:XP_001316424.1 Ser/Thr protein phosphatase [Trichomonas vaginalis G3]